MKTFLQISLPFQVAKLVLDDYFTNDEFLKSSEAMTVHADVGSMIPHAHQLPSQPSPFIDSGISLDHLLARSSSNILTQPHLHRQMTNDADDEVFVDNGHNDGQVLTSSSSVDSSSSSTTVVTDQANPSNGLSRSRRSHFSRKDSTPEMASKVKSDSESW